jgi:hypothetical protein
MPRRRGKSKLRGCVNDEGVMYCVTCGDDVYVWSYDKDIREDIIHFQRCIPCIAKGQASGALGPGLDGGTYHEGER